MAKVKCKLCKHLEDRKCTVKKTGGKNPTVKVGKNRICNKFILNVLEMSDDADRVYNKRSIHRYAPTWRYYASKSELKEFGEENGPLFIRTNPNV